MIQFNELRITPDNEYLIIDVSIEDAEYYKDVVLDSIVIDTQNTYIANGPSSKAVYTYNVLDEGYDAIYSIPENCGCSQVLEAGTEDECFLLDNSSKKHARLLLKSEDLGVPISGNMFFVYAISSGNPTAATPCELRSPIAVRTVMNLYPVYRQSMIYTKELGDTCSIPKNFIDYILKIRALDIAIRTGNYNEAIRYWNILFKNLYYNSEPVNMCGCYGKSN